MNRRVKKANGFTLIEALIATVVSVIILSAVVGVFKSSSDANRTVLLRADEQQDARRALTLINRDFSQASAGIPPAGIPVPPKAVFACDTSQCYLGGAAYPNNILSPVTPQVAIGANGTSVITIAYVDASWPVTNQDLLAIDPNGKSITVNPGNFDTSGIPVAAPAGSSYLSPVVGSQVGDVMLLQNNLGATVVTVTGVGGGGVLALAQKDPLLLNAPGVAAIDNPNKPGTYPPTVASRINVVTYFVASPNGIPVLMRQVSAHPAAPVVEGIQALTFTYDTFNAAAGPNGTYTPGLAAGLVNDASLIRKVNISLTLQSRSRDPQGNFPTLTVNSSVSPRDLSFSDRYM